MSTGERYGYLTVLELLPGGELGHHDGAWIRVRCDCGIRKTVRARHLRAGAIKSCTCKRVDLVLAACGRERRKSA